MPRRLTTQIGRRDLKEKRERLRSLRPSGVNPRLVVQGTA
jgi:hypothetical protein